MIIGRHRKTKHLYSERLNASATETQVRSAESGRTYWIPAEMFEPMDETWRYRVEDPLEGEPTEDPAEPEHPLDAAERQEILRMMAQEGQQAGMLDLRPEDIPSRHDVDLPALHAIVREKSYSIGTAMTLLNDWEPQWTPVSTVRLLRVVVAVLEDEIARVQASVGSAD